MIKLILILILFSTTLNAQFILPGMIGFNGRGTAAPPPESGFDWDALEDQAPTFYNDCGTLVVENKSFENLDLGTNEGDNVRVSGDCNITFRNCYFGPSIRKGLRVEGLNAGFTVRAVSCLFASNECGVEGSDSPGDIQIDSCWAVNPWGQMKCKGQFVQFAYCTGDGSYVKNSRIQSWPGEGNTEDLISMFSTQGSSGSHIKIANNKTRGGGPSNSGGGFIAGDGDGDYIDIEDNILKDPGNYIVAAAGGGHITIQNNTGWEGDFPWRNIATYAYITNASTFCSNITMTGNHMGLFAGDNYYCYCTPDCGDVTGVDESEGDPADGWRFSNFSDIDESEIDALLPAVLIDCVTEDVLWQIRDRSTELLTFQGSGGCYQHDPLPRPTSLAGSDQSININNATFAGGSSGASSPTYRWVFVSGPNTPTITTPTSATSTVTGLIDGTYRFRLEVTNGSGDGIGASDADWMEIVVLLT